MDLCCPSAQVSYSVRSYAVVLSGLRNDSSMQHVPLSRSETTSRKHIILHSNILGVTLQVECIFLIYLIYTM